MIAHFIFKSDNKSKGAFIRSGNPVRSIKHHVRNAGILFKRIDVLNTKQCKVIELIAESDSSFDYDLPLIIRIFQELSRITFFIMY